MTEGERNGMFWELARGYLETVASEAEGCAKLTPIIRVVLFGVLFSAFKERVPILAFTPVTVSL